MIKSEVTLSIAFSLRKRNQDGWLDSPFLDVKHSQFQDPFLKTKKHLWLLLCHQLGNSFSLNFNLLKGKLRIEEFTVNLVRSQKP